MLRRAPDLTQSLPLPLTVIGVLPLCPAPTRNIGYCWQITGADLNLICFFNSCEIQVKLAVFNEKCGCEEFYVDVQMIIQIIIVNLLALISEWLEYLFKDFHMLFEL